MVDCNSLEMVEHQLLVQSSADDCAIDQQIRYATIIQVDNEDDGKEDNNEDNADDDEEQEDRESFVSIHEDDQEEEEEEDGESFLSTHFDDLEGEEEEEDGESFISIDTDDLEEEEEDDLDPTLVFSLEQKLLIEPQIPKKSSSCSIQRVPNCFRQGDENAYVPQIVSIGPFHRAKEGLQAMEEQKRKYLNDVISWTQINSGDSRSKILEKYLISIKAVEKMARGYYSETINLNSNAFIQMMLVDGCFIIGLLCKEAQLIKIDDDDPIFKMVWLICRIKNDLLMLENQIPFVVLQRLFDLMNVQGGRDCPSLACLALDFFKELVPKIQKAMKEDPKINCQHLLHLFYSSLLPTVKEDIRNERNACIQLIIGWINAFKESVISFKKPGNNEREANHFNQIHSATVLKEAGITFKKVKAAESFFHVKFKNGTMEIPTVVIHGPTNSLFLNLLAFEQCYSDCTNHFTAYTVFMNCLINSAKDVGTLRQSGIIENWLGSDDEVAQLFKMLGRRVAISTDGFYLSKVFRDVNRYCQTNWGASCKESLKRHYSNNPLYMVPLVGAIILLVLTFIQAFFAMYSYFRPPS